jgi:hypothetical protein
MACSFSALLKRIVISASGGGGDNTNIKASGDGDGEETAFERPELKNLKFSRWSLPDMRTSASNNSRSDTCSNTYSYRGDGNGDGELVKRSRNFVAKLLLAKNPSDCDCNSGMVLKNVCLFVCFVGF